LVGLPTPRQNLGSLLPDGVPPGGEIHVLLAIAAAPAHSWTVQSPGTDRTARHKANPLVGVSYLAPTSKFIVRGLGFRGCARRAQGLYWFGQNIPTSSHQWLALPAPLIIKLVVRVTSD
jgi:hypothetical protein